MRPILSRRRFIGTSAAALAAGLPLARAVEPFERINPRIKGLSLAAYSFRDHLNWFKGKPTDGTMDLFRFLDYCAEQQIGGAELTAYFFPEPFETAYLNKIKRRAHILGLEITGGAIGNNFSFFPGSPEAKEQSQYVTKWIDAYADLGAPVIRVFAGNRGPEGATEDQVMNNVMANLYEALRHAEKRGVILAMENHDSMQDAERLLALARKVDSDFFGLTWDSGNLNPTADPYGELAKLAPYAVNAQVKVKIPVNGQKVGADFPRLVGILRDAGYAGYLVLEYEEAEDAFDAVPGHLEQLRAAIGG